MKDCVKSLLCGMLFIFIAYLFSVICAVTLLKVSKKPTLNRIDKFWEITFGKFSFDFFVCFAGRRESKATGLCYFCNGIFNVFSQIQGHDHQDDELCDFDCISCALARPEFAIYAHFLLLSLLICIS
jgi:hypothetical protein